MHESSLPIALHAIHVGRHLHHHFTGPRVDYVGVGLAAFVSWVAISGPGEGALIAGGISAAHGNVDIVGIVLVAWAGAMTGGIAGYAIGLEGGRALMVKPGPLLRTRRRLLRHGDEAYQRRGWLAVFLAPSWMAGISGMRVQRFLPANAVASLVWAVTIGLGSYFAGPSLAEAIGDIGSVGLVALIGLIAVAALLRRRRRRERPC